MTAISGIQIPKPKDWQQFERQIWALYRVVLRDPHTHMHGRQGQPQHGVDVYGRRDRDNSKYVGVQCKHKLDSEVTEAELKAELEKAMNFDPPISEFILVTTAPRDMKIQGIARGLTERQSKTDRPIDVSVLGWEDIENEVTLHPELQKVFDPTVTPHSEQILDEQRQGFDQVSQQLDALRLDIAQVNDPTGSPEEAESSPIHIRISTFAELVDSGQPRLAIDSLEKLQHDYGDLSDSEKARLFSVLAAAHLSLCDDEIAGNLLIESHDAAPERVGAKLNLAKGQLLLGRFDKALATASDLIRNEESVEEATGIAIQARVEEDGQQDPLQGISDELRKQAFIQVSTIHVLRKRGDESWRSAARCAVAEHPENVTLRNWVDEAALENLLVEDPDYRFGTVSDEDRAELLEVAQRLIERVDVAQGIGSKNLSVLANNAAVAQAFLGNESESLGLILIACDSDPDNESLHIQAARMHISTGNPAKGVDLLSSRDLSANGKLALAEAIGINGDFSDALDIVEGIPQQEVSQENIRNFISIKAELLLRLDRPNDAIEFLDSIEGSQENLVLLMLKVRALREIDDDEAATVIDQGVARLTDQSSMQERLAVFWELEESGRLQEAIDVLYENVDRSRVSPTLKELVRVLVNSDSRAKSKSLFEGLPETCLDDLSISRAKLRFQFSSGDPEALEAAVNFLESHPKEHTVRLWAIHALQVAGRADEIPALLPDASDAQDIDNAELTMSFAKLFITHKDSLEGINLAYRTLMRNWGDPRIHLFYQGIFLGATAVDVPDQGEIGEASAVVLRSKSGDTRRYRIEESLEGAFTAEVLAPTDELAQRLVGKKAGEEISLPSGFDESTWIVESIKHVWLDALHRSLEEFNERFPAEDGLRKVQVGGSPDDPVAEIREAVKARAERAESLLEVYTEKKIPLQVVAGIAAHDALNFYVGIVSEGHQVFVCLGTREEREEAVLLLKDRDRLGCVVDLVTLAVIHRLNLGEVVQAVCGPIATTQSVVDQFALRLEERIQFAGQKAGQLVYRDGELQMHEFTEEMIAKDLEGCQEELNWVREAVNVVSAVPSGEVAPFPDGLTSEISPSVIDPLLAASGVGTLLVSEDLGYRNLATAQFGLSCVWLQPILQVGLEEGAISRDAYSEAICDLALAGHTYISLDAEAIQFQLKRDGDELSGDVKSLLKILGGPKADLNSNSSVCAKIIDNAIATRLPTRTWSLVCAEVYNSLTTGQSIPPWQIVFGIVSKVSKDQAEVYDHALGWLIGHSIGCAEFNQLLELQKSGVRSLSIPPPENDDP